MHHSVLSNQTDDYTPLEMIFENKFYDEFEKPLVRPGDDALRRIVEEELEGIASKKMTYSTQSPVPGKEEGPSIGFRVKPDVWCELVLPRYDEHGNRIADVKLYCKGTKKPDPTALDAVMDSIILTLHAELAEGSTL